MPAAVTLSPDHADQVERYLVAMRSAGLRTGRSTTQAARTFSAKIQRAGGFDQLSLAAQIAAIDKARSFAQWLMVTGQLTVPAPLLGAVYLRLGTAARTYCPEAYRWFLAEATRLEMLPADVSLQWSTLAKVAALTGAAPDQIRDHEFEQARDAVIDAYVAHGSPEAGRSITAAFCRLQLTLFHAGRLSTHRRASSKAPVSITGWQAVTDGFAAAARRYIAQVDLSLRPNTTKHIEHDLREFGTWLATTYPRVATCADLDRSHIEAYKTWIASKHGRYTGKPLNRASVKNRLINLHCFFDRITEWGYPDPPQRPLIFTGDLPIVDKPLPRFLDDAAAAKLLRTPRRVRDHPCLRPSTLPHPRDPGHPPWHVPRRHRRPPRSQDPRDDDDLRPHRRQDRRRGVLRRHRQGRRALRPTPTTPRRGRRQRDAPPPRRNAPTHARQRLLRSPRGDGLPLRVHLRRLHLLRHHHRVPPHPRTPARRRREQGPSRPPEDLRRAARPARPRGSVLKLTHLDNQLLAARASTEAPDLPDRVWDCLATTINDEIAGLDETSANQLRLSLLIPPERYLEELTAFQTWMDIARANADNPVIVRAQVMTQLYVAFVWLRDSVMKPAAAAVSDQTAFATIERFLSSGHRRMLRNAIAIAHGRWCYLPDFKGLE